MFRIIINYKMLFIFTIKNGFFSEFIGEINVESIKPSDENIEVSDENHNGIILDDLLIKNQQDGITITELMKMDEVFQKEKDKISPETRANLVKYNNDVIKDLLNKGIILDMYINNPKGLKKLLSKIQEITGLDFSPRVAKYMKGYHTHHYIENFLKKNEIGILGNQISFLERDTNNSQSSNLYNSPEIVEKRQLLSQENQEFNEGKFIEAKKFYETIKPNSSQIRLVQKNIGTQVDGDFGPEMFKAIVEYQRKNKLYVDGKAGEDTLANLGLLKEGETIYDFYNGNEVA